LLKKTQFIKDFTDYLTSIERDSLISELKGLKDEKHKFMNEFNNLQENERQLKRERKKLKNKLL
jgi:FtsZ-binding cell division protein ZapB